MKPITYLQFQKHLSGTKIAPVYLISGEEHFLIDEAVKQLEKKINTDSLNREVFQAPDVLGKDIVFAVETLPFLTDKRVVILKMANKLKNADYEVITRIIENPVETSCFIILFPEKLKGTTSKRKDLISLCSDSENCICVECKKFYEKDAKGFVVQEFKARGKTTSYDVVNQIVNESGTDLLNLSNEIEKICLFIGKDKKEITEDDFAKISGFTKEINVFMLANIIEAKNLKYALFILEKMLENGEKPINLLTAISSTVRKLLTAKSLLQEKKYSQQETMDYIRVPAFFNFRKDYLNNLSKFTLEHLKKSMKEVLKADIAIKTGKSDDILALENLLIFICK